MPTEYAGVEQADVASVTAGGEFFRCYVYLNVAANAIDAVIFVEQADGQETVVWSGTVRDVENDGTATNVGDCPRVLALDDGTFVVHWMEWRSGNRELHRATFDTLAMASGWVYRSFISVEWNLYDHCIVRDGTVVDYCVTYCASSTGSSPELGTIGVTRFDGLAWTDTVWSVSLSTDTRNRVLCIVADDNGTAHVGVILQEIASYHLRLHELDAATGLNEASSVVTTGHGDSNYTSVGLVQEPEVSRATFVAEYVTRSNETTSTLLSQTRGIIYRVCDLGNGCAALTSVQTSPNLHLASRPWLRRAAYAGDFEAFVLVGFKSMADSSWNQSMGYVVKLNHRDWGASVGANTIRPILCSVLSGGSFDSRMGSFTPNVAVPITSDGVGKRANHLSHVSLSPTEFTQGPDVRSVVVAALFFERTIAFGGLFSEVPVQGRIQAAVKGVRFHHEEPWSQRLDTHEPGLPDSPNFKGFAPYQVGRSVEIQSGLVFAGGAMSQYDGRQLVEVGFAWRPEIIDTSVQTGGASNIDAGSYWVVATYSWVDSRGGIHRSAPSDPVERVTASDATSFTYRVRTIPLTLKDDRHHYPNAPSVLIEFWRTARTSGNAEGETVGSFIFRRCFAGSTQPISETPHNDATVESFEVIDDVENSVLIQEDPLAWQLNTETLQWTPAVPTTTVSAKAMSTWKNRVWSVPYDDPRVIQYSDEILPVGSQTAAPEHLATNTFRFDSRGDIVATHPLDNALIIFTRDAIYSLTGEGNDGTGQNASLQLSALFEGVGCVDEASIVRVDEGIMFQSVRGFYMLTRQQQLVHAEVGGALAELVRTMGNVREASSLPDRRVARFVANRQPLAGGTDVPVCLDYNFELGIWSEQQLPTMSAAAPDRSNGAQSGHVWRGRQGQECHVVLAENGMAVERGDDDTVYSDTNYAGVDVPVPIDVQTEWIHLGGMAGLQRVKSIGIQTERINAGEMTVQAWYDFIGDFDESTPSETFVFASPAPAYMLCKPASQKATSIMLRIYESGTVPQTENVRLKSITLSVAKKRGLRRVPRTQIGS